MKGGHKRIGCSVFLACILISRAYQLLWLQYALEWFAARCYCFIVFYLVIDSMRTSYLIHLNNGPCLECVYSLVHSNNWRGDWWCVNSKQDTLDTDFIDKNALYGHATMWNALANESNTIYTNTNTIQIHKICLNMPAESFEI